MENAKRYKPFELDCFVDITKNHYIHPFSKPTHGHLFIACESHTLLDYLLNHMINSVLTGYDMNEVKLSIYSQKMSDRANEINRYLHLPIMRTADELKKRLLQVKKIMDRRYKTFKDFVSRDIDEFNQKIINKQINKRILPFLLILIDELPTQDGRMDEELNTLIYEIAQKSRAAGIHIILTSTMPSKAMSPLLKYQMDGIIGKFTQIDDGIVLLGKRDGHQVLYIQHGDVMVYENNGNHHVYQITEASERPLVHKL